MASKKNEQRIKSYPDQFNTRENRLIRYGHSLLVSSAESVSLEDEDAISMIRNTGASTITLPPAASNKGRSIKFFQTDAAVLTIAQNADDANINGADSNFAFTATASNGGELYCDGTEWLFVSLTNA